MRPLGASSYCIGGRWVDRHRASSETRGCPRWSRCVGFKRYLFARRTTYIECDRRLPLCVDKYFRQLRPRERRRWNGTDGEFQRRRVRQHLREKQVRRPNVRGVRRQRVLQQPHHGLDQVKAVAAFNEQRRAGHCFVVDPPPARSFALFIRLMLIPGMYQIILTNNPSIASLTCLDARIPPVNLPREDLRATTSSPFLLHCGGRISFITPCHLIVLSLIHI